MRFLFQILFRAKTLIKLCYVKIGWLVTGIDLLCFSNKSIDEEQTSEGSEGNRKRNVLRQYEPKANYTFSKVWKDW